MYNSVSLCRPNPPCARGCAERAGVRLLTPEPAVAWLYPQNSPVLGPGDPLTEQRTVEPLQSPPCPWQRIRETPRAAAIGPSSPYKGPLGLARTTRRFLPLFQL